MKQLYMLRTLLIVCMSVLFGGGNFALAQSTETVTIWEEDWTGYEAKDKPDTKNSNYQQTNSSDEKSITEIYTTQLVSGGASGPELMIAKKNGSWTVTINDLKGCTGEVKLAYMANRALTITANEKNVTMSASSKKYTGTITLDDNNESLVIVFKNTNTSNNVRIDDIVLTGTKTSGPEFSFSASEATATLGEPFTTAPKFTNTYGGDVTYSSSDESVATIDASGTVTPLSAGTTTITATLASDNTVTASYTLTVKEAGLKTMTLSMDPASGEYFVEQNVTLIPSFADAKIYYTTDGTDPVVGTNEYTAAIPVTISGTTIKALAVAEGYENATAEATYTIKPDQPVFSAESQTFKSPLEITLTLPNTVSTGSTIHYAIGATATAESAVYDGTPIKIEGTNDGDKIILHAVVVDEYGNVGKEKYCTYTYTSAIVFNFNENPNVWNITPTNDNTSSNTDGKKLPVEGVVLTTASGTGNNKTCIWNTLELRMYTGGSITLTAPANYEIASVVFTGTISLKEQTTGTAVSNSKWTGNATSVTFVYGGSTCRIKTITVTLKEIQTGKFTITAGGYDEKTNKYYGTYFTDVPFVAPENVTCATVSVEGGKLKINPYAAGETIPANTGLMISSDKADEFVYEISTEDNAVAHADNMLKGSVEGAMTEGDNCIFYRLTKSSIEPLGFWWGAENGGAFMSGANKAYLAVPSDVASQAKGFSFAFDVTAISNVDATVEAGRDVIYNMAGQRLNSITKPGLYIKNGKKVIVK